jgi:hypothetical protein
MAAGLPWPAYGINACTAVNPTQEKYNTLPGPKARPTSFCFSYTHCLPG